MRMLERAADYGSRLPIFQHHSHPVLLDSRLLVHFGFSYIWNVEYSIWFSWTDYRLFNDFSQTCPAFCTSSSDMNRFILNDIHKLFLTTPDLKHSYMYAPDEYNFMHMTSLPGGLTGDGLVC